MKELTTKSAEQAKHGDRFIIQNIEESDFQGKAKAFKEAAEAKDLSVGIVHHRPIETGMIFIKLRRESITEINR
jgi:hypothetical protein